MLPNSRSDHPLLLSYMDAGWGPIMTRGLSEKKGWGTFSALLSSES
jgi:hypothetical protein